MPKQFISARSKIGRTNHHINEFNAGLSQILAMENLYRLRVESKPDGDVLQLEILEPLPIAFALILGDAIHCLRTALDHVASEMVRNSGKDASRVGFPFHEKRENLVDMLKNTPIKHAGPEIGDIILNHIKPYEAGNRPLWSLNKLDNIDKHRLLIPVLGMSAVAGVDAEDDKGAKIINCTFASDGPGRHNMVKVGGRLKIKNYGKPTLSVFFGKGQFFESEPVVPTLVQLTQLVLGVIDALESAHFK